jgi:hypothetical protein
LSGDSLTPDPERWAGRISSAEHLTVTPRWRKRKGIARIKLRDGTIKTAELHWYEAHGIGCKELKIKRFLP